MLRIDSISFVSNYCVKTNLPNLINRRSGESGRQKILLRETKKLYLEFFKDTIYH